MKIALDWIADYLSPIPAAQIAADALMNAGLPVESITDATGKDGKPTQVLDVEDLGEPGVGQPARGAGPAGRHGAGVDDGGLGTDQLGAVEQIVRAAGRGDHADQVAAPGAPGEAVAFKEVFKDVDFRIEKCELYPSKAIVVVQ